MSHSNGDKGVWGELVTEFMEEAKEMEDQSLEERMKDWTNVRCQSPHCDELAIHGEVWVGSAGIHPYCHQHMTPEWWGYMLAWFDRAHILPIIECYQAYCTNQVENGHLWSGVYPYPYCVQHRTGVWNRYMRDRRELLATISEASENEIVDDIKEDQKEENSSSLLDIAGAYLSRKRDQRHLEWRVRAKWVDLSALYKNLHNRLYDDGYIDCWDDMPEIMQENSLDEDMLLRFVCGLVGIDYRKWNDLNNYDWRL